MSHLIIYASIHHGNTEKLGKAMAKQLKADFKKTSEVNGSISQNYDFIGFGSGVYNGKFHADLIRFIDSMPTVSGKKAFVFSTSGSGNKKYNKVIKEKLKEKGFLVVGDFSCKGYDTYSIFKLIGGIAKGRPNAEDLQRAQEFIEHINK